MKKNQLLIILTGILLTLTFVSCISKARTVKISFPQYPNIETISIKQSSLLDESILPKVTKDGYTFSGWFVDELCLNKLDLNKPVDANLKIYAKFDINSYNIYFKDGDTILEDRTIEVIYDNFIPISFLPGVEHEGYTFIRWEYQGSPLTITKMPSHDLTMVARYQVNSFNVTFIGSNGNVVRVIEAEYGETFFIPSNITPPSKTGHTGVWDFDNVNGIVITENITINAIYTPITYTVTYKDLNSNLVFGTEYVVYGNNLVGISEDLFVKIGYQYKGYYSSQSDLTVVDFSVFSNLTISSNLTIYVAFDPISIHYSFVGLEGQISQGNIVYSQPLTLLSELHVDGYTFIGWKFNNGTVYNALEVVNLYEDVVFTAIYEFNVYELVFNAQEGKFNSDNLTTHVFLREYRAYLVESSSFEIPTRAGYTFSYWYKIVSGNEIQFNINSSTQMELNGIVLYAKYVPSTYSITYNAAGGTVNVNPSSQYVTTDSNFPTLPTPTYLGYRFLNWTYNSVVITSSTKFELATNITLTANYEPIDYTIDIDYKGGIIVGTNPVTYTILDSEITIINPTKEGYTFIGYNKEGEETKYLELKIPTSSTGNKKYIANYVANNYVVNYILNGGSGSVSSKVVTFDNSYSTLLVPTKVGYLFNGWFLDEEFTTSIISTTIVKTANNHNLYAKYSPITYNINFNANGGTNIGETSMPTINVEYGELINLSELGYKKNGYEFVNWNTYANGTGNSYSNLALVSNLSSINNSTVNLYAIWSIITYTVTFDSDQAQVYPNYNYTVLNSDYILPSPSKVGYIFDSWRDISDLTTKITNIDSSKAKNYNLKAIYTPITYTIKFNANGGTNQTDSILATYGQEITLTENNFSRVGYNFVNWNRESNGFGTSYSNSSTVSNLTTINSSQVNLYAIWEAKKFDITYVYNGGTTGASTKEVTYNSQYGTLPSSSKTGYIFEGWYLTESFENKIETTSIVTITENSQVYAKWNPITYTIKFNANGGTNQTDSILATYGQEITLTENNFSRVGYNFVNWNRESNGSGTSYSDLSIVSNLTTINSSQVNLYAIWEAKKFDITYVYNGGTTGASTKEVTYNSQYGTLPSSSKTGYIFEGWYLTESFENKIETTSIVTITENSQVYAKWNPITYTIKFNANGGTNQTESILATYGQEITLTENNFSRVGYNFVNWNRESNGSGTSYSDSSTVSNLTTINSSQVNLYAIWEALEYTIFFDASTNSGSTTVDSKSVTYDVIVGELPLATKELSYFSGWYTSASSGTRYLPSTIFRNTTDIYLYAQFTDYPSINFDSLDSETEIDSIILPGDTVLATYLPAIEPIKVGYTFNYWETEEHIEFDFSVELMPYQTITLYAKYSPITYYVSFNKGNSTSINMSNQQFTYDTSGYLPLNTYTLEGYVFDGWSLDSELSSLDFLDNGQVTNLTSTADNIVTLYAIFSPITYVIRYNFESSSYNQILTYDLSEELYPNSFTLTGYSFNGWSLSEEGEIVYTDSQSVLNLSQIESQVIDLYASWIKKNFIITFNYNQGTETLANKNVTYDLPYGELPTSSKTGYIFEGWYLTETFENKIESVSTVKITENSQVYAKWSGITYTIRFNSNSGVNLGSEGMEDIIVNYDESVSLTELGYKKNGYDFVSWNTSNLGLGNNYDNLSSVSNLTTTNGGIVTLYAIWEAKQYSVTFEAYLASLEDDEIVVYYDSQYGTLPTPNLTGYQFINWYKEDSFTNVITSSSIVNTSQDHTLYAKFSPIQYQISFSGNGNTGGTSMSNQIFTYDQGEYLSSNTYEKAGYTFIGWAISSNSEVLYLDHALSINLSSQSNDIIYLYAKWSANKIIVSLETYNGSLEEYELEVTFDSAYGSLPTPSLTGYTFVKWYKESTFTNEVTSLTLVSNQANHTIYAKYQQNTITIIFNPSYTTSETMENQETYYDVLTELNVNEFVRDYFEFKGWHLSGSEEIILDNSEVINLTTEGNVTLYAIWEAIQYTINYYNLVDANNSSNPTYYTYISNDISLDEPTRTGYEFDGWYLDNSYYYEAGEVQISSGSNGVKSFYAKWTPIKYFITFNTGEGSSVNLQHLDFDSLVTLPTNPVRVGYAFAGWYITDDYETEWDFDNDLVKGDAEIIAKWDDAHFLVSFVTVTNDYYFSTSTGEKTTIKTANESSPQVYDYLANTVVNFFYTEGSYTGKILPRFENSGYEIKGVYLSDDLSYSFNFLNYDLSNPDDYLLYSQSLTVIGPDLNLVVVYDRILVRIDFISSANDSQSPHIDSYWAEYNSNMSDYFSDNPYSPVSRPNKIGYWLTYDFSSITGELYDDELNLFYRKVVLAIYFDTGSKSVIFRNQGQIIYQVNALTVPGSTDATKEAINISNNLIWNISRTGYYFLGWYLYVGTTIGAKLDKGTYTFEQIGVLSGISSGVIEFRAEWRTLVSLETPTSLSANKNVNGSGVSDDTVTITFVYEDKEGDYPIATEFYLYVDGTSFSNVIVLQRGDESTLTGNTYTFIIEYVDDVTPTGRLFTLGNHELFIKAIGDNIVTKDSNNSSSYSYKVETQTDITTSTTRDTYIIQDVIVEGTNYKKFIFFTNMSYGFENEINIISGSNLISLKNNNKTIETGTLIGEFRFNTTSSTSGLINCIGYVALNPGIFEKGTNYSQFLTQSSDSSEYLNSEDNNYYVGYNNDYHVDLRILNSIGAGVLYSNVDLKYSIYKGVLGSYESTDYLDDMPSNEYVTINGHNIRFLSGANNLHFVIKVSLTYEALLIKADPVYFEVYINSGYNAFNNDELKLLYEDKTKQTINIHANITAILSQDRQDLDGSPKKFEQGSVYVRDGVHNLDDNIVINGNYMSIDGSKLPYETISSDNLVGYVTGIPIIEAHASIFWYNVKVVNQTDLSGLNNNQITISNLRIKGNTKNFTIDYNLSQNEIASQELLMSRNSGGVSGIYLESGSGLFNNLILTNLQQGIFSDQAHVSSLPQDIIGVFDDNQGYNIGRTGQVHGSRTKIQYTHFNDMFSNSMYLATNLTELIGNKFENIGGPAIHLRDYVPEMYQITYNETTHLYTQGPGVDALGNIVVDPSIFDSALVIHNDNDFSNYVAGDGAWFKAYAMSEIALTMKVSINSQIQNAPIFKTLTSIVRNPVNGLDSEMLRIIVSTEPTEKVVKSYNSIIMRGNQNFIHFQNTDGSWNSSIELYDKFVLDSLNCEVPGYGSGRAQDSSNMVWPVGYYSPLRGFNHQEYSFGYLYTILLPSFFISLKDRLTERGIAGPSLIAAGLEADNYFKANLTKIIAFYNIAPDQISNLGYAFGTFFSGTSEPELITALLQAINSVSSGYTYSKANYLEVNGNLSIFGNSQYYQTFIIALNDYPH